MSLVECDRFDRNRMVGVTEKTAPAGTVTKTVTYEYDVWDRLIFKGVDEDPIAADGYESTERLVYDGADVVLRFTGGADGASSLANRYLNGPAVDMILADEQIGGDVLWPLTDHQGTVRDLVKYSGGATTIVNSLDYDAFGNVLSESNAAVDHLYGYAGYLRDETIGQYVTQTRWYDPLTGKWTTEDWIGFAGGDANLGRYVGNGAPNRRDPLGLDWRFWTWFEDDGETVGEWWEKDLVLDREAKEGAVRAARRGGLNEEQIEEIERSHDQANLEDVAELTELVVETLPVSCNPILPAGGAAGRLGRETIEGATDGARKVANAIERHHQLPRQFAREFKRAGIENIDDYIIEIDKCAHRLKPNGLHTNSGGNWNKTWKEFFTKNENPSRQEVLNKLAEMRKQFGLEQ